MTTLSQPCLVCRLASSLLLGLLSGVIAQTQTPSGSATAPMPASAYKLISVKVIGSKRFTSEEVAAASGLPVGTIAHEDDFKKASRQLGESGAFSNIAYSFSYSASGTRLEFQVTDADVFVPARFSDFVWFSDEELGRKLHERIPLYKGYLPSSGRLVEQVSDVLQAMLVESAVPGVVEYVRNSSKEGKLQSIDYNVAGVSIRIRHIDFPGATPSEMPMLEAAAEKLVGREYSRAYMSSFTDQTVLPTLHQHGYLKAACGPPEPKVVKVTPTESDTTRQPPTFVDVTFSIAPGIQYKLSRWDWSGNQEIRTDELQALLHAKVGETANTVQLQDDLRAVQALYGTRGYILATVKVSAEFDDAGATVVFHLAVNEDSVFHMGELEFRGLDNNLTALLRAAWKLRPGDVYDASYLKEYLPKARKLLPASLDWEVATHVTALTKDKTVDVDLQYTAKAPQ